MAPLDTPQFSQARGAGDAAIALREKRYPPLRIAIAVQTLAEEGFEAAALLEGTGLDAAALANPQARVSSLQLLTVARNGVRMGCRSDAGLRVGLRYHASCYGMLGYAMLCSVSLRQTFDTAKRYLHLGSSMFDQDWIEGPQSAVWTVPEFHQLSLPELSPELYAFLRDMSLAAPLTVIKDVMGDWCTPLRVAFTGPPPPHAERLAQAFACPLAFDAPRNELHYAREWLERAPQLANPFTAAEMSSTCARLLDELKWQSGTTRRVYRELTLTPGRFPEIEEVASKLCMTSRTLRRKLEAEGNSFTELLDSVRSALAVDCLRTTVLNIDEIANVAGFSDPAGFRRAFKRWTGKSPHEYRA